MSHQDDLVRLVSPPTDQVVEPDWSATEARLRTELPNDYKWLVGRYGPGSFDDFLHILQPGVLAEPIQLEHQADSTAWALDYLRRGGEVVPYENSELLPFCKTDNGDVVYWLRRPADHPDLWTVTVNEARGPTWSEFKGGAIDFLVAVLSATHRIPMFPDDFPSDNPTFKPYGP